MYRICCYCQKPMGEKEPFDDESISHGICHECFVAEMKNIEKEDENEKEEDTHSPD